MESKTFYEDPNLELLRFQIGDIMTISDTGNDEDGYIELPIDPA